MLKQINKFKVTIRDFSHVDRNNNGVRVIGCTYWHFEATSQQ